MSHIEENASILTRGFHSLLDIWLLDLWI